MILYAFVDASDIPMIIASRSLSLNRTLFIDDKFNVTGNREYSNRIISLSKGEMKVFHPLCVTFDDGDNKMIVYSNDGLRTIDIPGADNLAAGMNVFGTYTDSGIRTSGIVKWVFAGCVCIGNRIYKMVDSSKDVINVASVFKTDGLSSHELARLLMSYPDRPVYCVVEKGDEPEQELVDPVVNIDMGFINNAVVIGTGGVPKHWSEVDV